MPRVEGLVTFLPSVHEQCNDDDDHYRSDAQRDDEKIVVDTRNRDVIWEKDEEGVVFKFAAKLVTHERQGQDMCWHLVSDMLSMYLTTREITKLTKY